MNESTSPASEIVTQSTAPDEPDDDLDIGLPAALCAAVLIVIALTVGGASVWWLIAMHAAGRAMP